MKQVSCTLKMDVIPLYIIIVVIAYVYPYGHT